jgi:hypothetical protein
MSHGPWSAGIAEGSIHSQGRSVARAGAHGQLEEEVVSEYTIQTEGINCDVPTLTAVLLSSSEARLPPGRLPVLMRLVLRGGRIMALMGRVGMPGDPGGEVAVGIVITVLLY